MVLDTLKHFSQIKVVFVYLIILNSCNPKPEFFKYQGYKHTSFHITYEHCKNLNGNIDSIFQSWYHSLNVFDTTSIVSKINNNQPVQLDSLFCYTFKKAQYFSDISEGAFDITCSPLINAWGFGIDERQNISGTIIDSIKHFVGYRKVSLIGRSLIKQDQRIQLNFSGLADGAICDEISKYFESLQINNYLIEIGGEIIAKGVNNQGRTWRLGIIKPIEDLTGQINEINMVVTSESKISLATSGNYRNFYYQNNEKISHTINPETGYPSRNSILSATVLSENGITSDALATIAMVLGVDSAKILFDGYKNIDYYFIYSAHEGKIQTIFSDGFENYSTE